MANSNTIAIEITVDDKGSATIKQFAQNSEQALQKTEASSTGASGAIGGLKESWLGLSAAALAAWAVINKALSWAEIGAKADQTRQTFQAVSASYGVHADDIVSAAKRATDGTVGSSLIMQKAMKAMTQDVDPNRIPELFEAARVSARIAGVSVGEAVDTIIDSTANNMPRALRQFGLVSKEEMGIFNKAIAAGVEDVKLLDFVMATAKIRMAELGGVAKNDAERFQEFQTVISGLTKTIGGVVLDFVRGVYGGFASISAGAMMLVGGLTDVGAGLTWLSAKAAEFMGNKDNAAAMRKEYESLHKTATDWYGAAAVSWNQTLDLFDKNTKASKTYTAAELENLRSQKAGMLDNLTAQTEAAKNKEKTTAAGEAAAKKLEAAERELTNEIQKTIADRKKYEGSFYNWKAAEVEAGLQKYRDAGVSEVKIAELRKEKLINVNAEIYAEYKKTLLKWEEDTKKKQVSMIEEEEKATEATEKAGLDRLVAYQLLYKDMEGYEGQYYDVSRRLIEEKAVTEEAILTKGLTDFEEIEKAKFVVAQATTLKLKQLDIEKGKASDDFFAGMKAGIAEIQLRQTKWGEVGYASFKAMSSGMASTFSTVFEDAYKRDMKSIGDYSTMIWDKSRAAFFDAVGKMASEKILLFLEANWTDNGATALKVVDKLLGLAGKVGDLWDTAVLSFSDGGVIPGNARFPGDHPGNDTVPIWASPGEVMIRRSSVNSETSAILDYINKFGAIPSFYGGGVINTITDEPGRGYWGFGDIFKVFTNPAEFIDQNLNPARLSPQVAWVNDQVGGAISRYIEPVAKVLGIVTQAAGTIAMVATGNVPGAAAWAAASTYGRQLAASSGQNISPVSAGISAAMAAAGAYLQGLNLDALEADRAFDMLGTPEQLATNAGGTGRGLLSTWTAEQLASINQTTLMDSILTSFAKTVASATLSVALGSGKDGAAMGNLDAMKFSLPGGDASGVSDAFHSLFNGLPKSQIISARNGLDCVPRDGVLVETHKKEAILNADAADQWRSGRGSGDVSELLGELKKLNASLDRMGFVLAKNTGKSARILDQWNGEGTPGTRVLS